LRTPMKNIVSLLVCAVALASACFAASPLRVPVRVALTNDAGLGYEWYVVGSHPDVGAWNPMEGIKLVYSAGNVWWADVGVQAGTTLEYKFVKRLVAADDICDASSAVWWPEGEGNNLQLQVPTEPAAPYDGKQVDFYTDMTNVNLVYSMLSSADSGATGAWYMVGMSEAGSGLLTGEKRYHAEGVGTEGEWMRFTFNGLRNGALFWEHAEDGNDFWCPLDAMAVHDQQVFNYTPPSNGASASQVVETNVASSFAGVTGRTVRIYLPRGYNENPDRSYPVVYMSDGENVFQPGGSFGCWNADTTADAEIQGGRMRETIIVGVPSAADRTIEYLPQMDANSGYRGKADIYADFLIHNVRPTIDFHYRTKNDRVNTGCIGSSSGGLLSMYLGTWTNTFGLVGALSGIYSTNFCPNYMAWLASAQPHDARVWMDVGTDEAKTVGTDLYDSNFELYWYLMGFGYAPNADLRFEIGCGAEHNEAAWASRLPYIYRFLLDVREEANGLLPQEVTLFKTGTLMQVSFPAYDGTTYAIEKKPLPLAAGEWSPVTNWARESTPWTQRTVHVTATNEVLFYRVKGE